MWQEGIGTVGDIIGISTDITFRGIISIKLGTVMSEFDRAAKLLFSEQMTQHTNLTPHTIYNCLYAVLHYWVCITTELLATMSNLRESLSY